MTTQKNHIPILKCFDEFKFNLGKKTLIEFLKGNLNPTIERNNLDELKSYGELYKLEKEEIENIINQLIAQNYLALEKVNGNFIVVKRTSLGIKEIFEKKFKLKDKSELQTLHKEKSKIKFKFKEDPITKEEEKIFQTFDFFLNKYNDKQKKAILSNSKSVLCIAGAGTGKTTVLTKRIEFLVKFKSTKEKKILAITFTKKAKEEMKHRLEELGIINAKVETFNSFCEKLLKKHGDKIYDKEIKVAQFRDKIKILRETFNELNVNFEFLKDNYFNKRQLREKTSDELFFIFVNDIFSIIDFYKNIENDIKPFYERARNLVEKNTARQIYKIAKKANQKLKDRGLRDFSDQILDALKLFKKHSGTIPEFEHILIDEFQDVNKIQIDLIKLLKYQNIFAVGDPRQAIYGWRGSDIEYILNFPNEFENTTIIELENNYRSSKNIVDLFNLSIKSLGLVDLKAAKDESNNENKIYLIENENELLEKKIVFESILKSENPRNEIFVLARTNKTLDNFAKFFRQNKIPYAIKTEEEYKDKEPGEKEIVLATVHSIKGMEAKEVYLVGCNNLSFPNKVQDNFVFALVKEDSTYNKEAEELRLFYVAISRAKEKLTITYTGNFSKFITKKMLDHIEFKTKNKSLFEFANKTELREKSQNYQILKNLLKEWRAQKAKETSLPLYMIISNDAIEDIAKLNPQTKTQLYNAKGMGEGKISKYGEEILSIINE